jgi:hypothetical protein
MSTGHQVNSSLYACRSGMGTGLTFSVVRYGLADSRFAVGVLGADGDVLPAGTCLTHGRRCETFSLLLSQSTQTAAPRFSGRCSRIKPDSGAGGCRPRVPFRPTCGLPEGRPLLRLV